MSLPANGLKLKTGVVWVALNSLVGSLFPQMETGKWQIGNHAQRQGKHDSTATRRKENRGLNAVREHGEKIMSAAKSGRHNRKTLGGAIPPNA